MSTSILLMQIAIGTIAIGTVVATAVAVNQVLKTSVETPPTPIETPPTPIETPPDFGQCNARAGYYCKKVC